MSAQNGCFGASCGSPNRVGCTLVDSFVDHVTRTGVQTRVSSWRQSEVFLFCQNRRLCFSTHFIFEQLYPYVPKLTGMKSKYIFYRAILSNSTEDAGRDIGSSMTSRSTAKHGHEIEVHLLRRVSEHTTAKQPPILRSMLDTKIPTAPRSTILLFDVDSSGQGYMVRVGLFEGCRSTLGIVSPRKNNSPV